MTQTLTHREKPLSGPQAATTGKPRKFFGAAILFVRQVIAELRKVVTPTRKELGKMTLIVVVFLAIMVLFVTALDLAFGSLSSLIFRAGTGDN